MKIGNAVALAGALAWMTMALAWAQGEANPPVRSVEELQRMLDEEVARQQHEQEEQRRSAPSRPRSSAPVQPPEPERPQPGALLLRANAECDLSVNGQSQGRLTVGEVKTVEVNPGEQLVECNAGPQRRVESIEHVPTGEQKAVTLTLPAPPRFQAVSDGVLDNELGLVWSASDNGSDINFQGARRYCASKGRGWQLPALAYLVRLQGSDAQGIRCGRATCRVPSLFQLSNPWLWSSDSVSNSDAWYINMDTGQRRSFAVGRSEVRRALCMRPR